MLLNFSERGSGVPIVLIHGLLGSMDNLNMVARKLCEHYRVINIDVRNHGESFHQNNMQYTELAIDVINLLNHLAIEKTVVLGHSMGGKIAMQLALDHSNRISTCIVADIAPVAYPPHHQHILAGLKAIDLTTIKSRQDADKQLAPYVSDAGVRQFLLRNLAKNDNGFYFKCALDYISDCYPQIMKGYEGNGCFEQPTLFIKGGNSDYLKPEHQPIIQSLFPKAQAKVISGAGHWLHAEKSTIFNKIVLDFLADIPQV
jgi:esterase